MTKSLWSKQIVFSEELKNFVRKPLGKLKSGDVGRDEELVHGKPLVVIGDYTFEKVVGAGLRPDVVVVDGRVERRHVGLPNLAGYEIKKVENMPGTIEPEAAEAVVSAVVCGKGAVLVIGEEDLLALPAMHALPDGGVLVYGQPGVGYVVVHGSEETRRMVEEIVRLATA